MVAQKDIHSQFSLAALFGAVIACGVIFGFLANMKASYHVSIRCRSLPADDQRLVEWFEEQDGVQYVSTSRDGNTINVQFTKRYGSFKLFAPPLAELGYTDLQGMQSTISNSSIIGGAMNWVSSVPVLAWFAISAVFTALLARKIIRGRASPMTDMQSHAELDA